MNKVFNFNRFVKYLHLDVKNVASSYGISMIIMALCPVICFVFFEVMSLVIGQTFVPQPVPVRIVMASIAIFVVCVSAPAKMYGAITDKRYGSMWLSIPASTFEKWLSMIVVTCVVLPICFLVTIVVGDVVTSLLFPNLYGKVIFAQGILSQLKEFMDEVGLYVNIPAVAYVNWCEWILIFLLGAICFKKGKVAKTILAYFLVSWIVGSIVSVAFFKSGLMASEEVSLDLIKGIFGNLNTVTVISTLLCSAFLLGSTYYRIRTIKH